MHNHQDIEKFAKQLASAGGKFLLEQYQHQDRNNLARRESPKAMKLAEDKTIDEWLIKKIRETYPDHDILTEESGAVAPIYELGLRHNQSMACHYDKHELSEQHVRWIIDPIDGSVNFSTRNPFVAISLAVCVPGEVGNNHGRSLLPTIGVIEAPLLGEQFAAVKGAGATVNGKSIQVSKTDKLSDAYLVSCDGGMTDRSKTHATIIQQFYDQVIDIRKLGSAALECAWVAAGRADGYITMKIDPWDVAAGVLIVEEAGGKVTTFDNKPWKPEQADIICSNGKLHDQLAAKL